MVNLFYNMFLDKKSLVISAYSNQKTQQTFSFYYCKY